MGSRSTPATLFLDRHGVTYRTHGYELAGENAAASYGEAVAAELGVPPAQLFKTLVALVDGRPVVAVVPVDRQLRPKSLASAAGGSRARLAEPADAERLTGYVTGGISPFGQRRRLPVFADGTLLEHATVFVSGGRRGPVSYTHLTLPTIYSV